MRGCITNLLGLARTSTDPFLCLVPGLVKGKQPCLATTLDQLIRFRDKLGGEHPSRELGFGGDSVGLWVPRDLCNLRCRENEGSGELAVRIYRRSTFEPVCEEQFCVVFTDGWRKEKDLGEYMRGAKAEEYLWMT
jgi:hypothetical protein